MENFDCSTVTDVSQIECEALVALYGSTNGAGWTNNTNWLQSTTVSNWFGIYVLDDSGVTELDLDDNQLTGTLPAELGNLSNLEYLGLYDNQLTGSIPSTLGNLSYLGFLDLRYNQLTGSIPSTLGNLSYLVGLDLGHNQLTGSIPTSLGDLSYVRYLYLDNNQLTGSIPESLGNLSNMNYLYLFENQLSGNIPAALGDLSDIEVLDLSNNQLTGSIPAVLGNLPDLYDLALHHNQLTGSLPVELGNLSDLEYLGLSENQFTGSIPLSFVNLTRLIYFQFDETSLCEPTTPEFLAWKNTVDEWYGTGIICGENLPPVALDDSYITPLNTTLNVSAPGVLSNDTDADNDALTAIKLSDPASGTLTFNIHGSFIYVPAPDFSGTVSFTYKANDGDLDSNSATVSIMVGTNTAPVAQAQEVMTDEDTAIEITLEATDVDGQSLTYSIVGQAGHGSLSLVAGNKVTYTPALNYFGPDSFTFKANDGFADSLPAIVTITVTAVNDAPVAQPQTVTTPEDTAISINLAASDVDNTTLTYSIVTQPTHGSLSALSGNKVTYTPNKDYNGTDSFTFKANDGSLDSNVATVTIKVTLVNHGVIANDDSYETFVNLTLVVDAEEGVLANDVLLDPEETVIVDILRRPESGTLFMNDDGSFSFVPKEDFWGILTFDYRVHSFQKSGEWFDDATVTILVKPLVAIYLPLIFK